MENGLTTIRVNTSDVNKMRNGVPGISDVERFNKVMAFWNGNYDKAVVTQLARNLNDFFDIEIFKKKK